MFHAVPAIEFKKNPRSEPQCVQRRCVAVVIHYCAAPSLLRPQITTRCAQSSSHSLGASWDGDILFQNPLHIVSGMSMCSVKYVVVIVVLLPSVDVGRSWFAGCGRQASLHFPFINSKQHLLWGRSCVCVVLLPLRTSTARFLLISYIPSLVKRMWLRGAWHQLWAPSSSNHTFSSLLANHIHIPWAIWLSFVRDNIMFVCMAYLLFSDQRHSKKEQE